MKSNQKKIRQLLLLGLVCTLPSVIWAQTATYDQTVVSDKCWSENSVIATSTQQNALVAYKNFVYMTFYNTERKLSIARNKNFGVGDDWVIIELPHTYEKRNGKYDNHNTPNIAISPNDGRIHLSFDMHARDLRYRISSENAATVPDSEFNADLFSDTRNYLESNQSAIKRVTYPRFFVGENQHLFFMYRNGGSGNGDSYMVEYKDDGSWNAPLEIIDGNIGSHNGSDSRCAYFNDVHFKDGKIYLTWVWRETPDVVTNHDLMFAYSEDSGKSWKNSAGTTISRPMNLNSPGIKVASIPTGSGLTNHHGCAVDGHGNVHVVLRIDGSYIHHYGVRKQDAFNWFEGTITSFGGDRPKFYCDQTTNDLYFLVRQGSKLRLFATPTHQEKWDQWSEIGSLADLFRTSTNSHMNTSGDLLISMAVSTDDRLQAVNWSLSTSSPKIDNEVSVSSHQVVENAMNIFPNPAPTGIFNLSEKVYYRVYAMDGTAVTEGQGARVDLSNSPRGLYVLHANNQLFKLMRE